MASTDGWATVTAKKAQVAPHLRQKEAAEAKKSAPETMDVSSSLQFPSLGGTKQSSVPSTKMDFKQKVHDLIELDKRTEAEREAAAEAARAMGDFVSLSLRFDKERWAKLTDREIAIQKREAEYSLQNIDYEVTNHPFEAVREEEDENMVHDDE